MNALGVDLGGTKIEAVLLDAAGAERWRRRIAAPHGDYAATLEAVVALADAAQAVDGAPFSVGIGTPGAAAPDGRMKNSNSTWLNGRPLADDLRRRLGRPLALANDANCLALSEASDGAGAGAGVVFAAILGTGTGAGIAVDGRVLEGPNRLAGEWGHNPLPWAEAADEQLAPCYCGQRGCIEAWCSGPALARDHAATGGEALDARTVARRAAAGDAACRATLERHAHRLARALAAVVNLLDPDVIVLGGGLSRMPHLYPRVPALWSRWIFGAQAAAPRTKLLPALHGDASGVRGAAWLGRQAV